jgi:uncharacterized protein with WD repeat
MSIEENLGRIATALEKIAANGGTLAPAIAAVVTNVASKPEDDKLTKAASDKRIADAKAAEDKAAADADAKAAADAKADAAATAAAPTSTSKATKDDVRKALQAYREIEGTPAMLEVLKGFGASNLNELKEAQYDEVVAKVS